MKTLATVLCLFVVGGGAMSLADEEVVVLEEHRSVSPAQEEWKVTVPPFSVEHQVRLSLEVRIDWRDLAGSNPWMRVAVNGQYLTKPDLLNKRDEFTLRRGMDLSWSKGDRWRVLYSPDFEQAITDRENPNACPEADPYRYVWDITRYVHPGENVLRIENLQVLTKPTTMVLRNVKVEAGKAVSPPSDERAAPAPTGPLRTYVAKGAREVPTAVSLARSGGIAVTVAGMRFEAATRTSLPEGRWHEAGAGGEGQVVARGESAQASWEVGPYRVERKVTHRPDHVHVSDTITNTTKELIGVIVGHRVKGAGRPDAVLLAGRTALGGTSAERSPSHPSAFGRWGEMGLGMVAEDDVFRVHVRSFREPEAIGLADDMLGIAPGASVTLEWSLFPTPGGDPWEFLNAVRRAWDTNFTIPGPFCFSMAFHGKDPPGTHGEWARQRGLKITCGGIASYPGGKYAHGTGILHAPQWVAKEREWIAKMTAEAPEVKALCYFHAQCSTEPGGEETYADSRLIDAKGEHLGYPYRYRLPLYLPTRENAYGKALWGYVRTILDTIGASGIYWDEMSHSVLQFAHQAPWDGHTVAIDSKTHAVTGRRSSVTLLMQPLHLDIVRHTRERGRFLMANTQATTRALLREKIVRFVEAGSYSAVIGTQLGCPLALGNHHEEDTQADRATHVRRFLEHGGLYYGHTYYDDPAPWNFTEAMFPITPAELHEGVVLGEERIHAARSGRFGWPDGAPADVYVVDAQGVRVAAPNVKDVVEEGRRLYEIRMPGDHFAVLVKRAKGA